MILNTKEKEMNSSNSKRLQSNQRGRRRTEGEGELNEKQMILQLLNWKKYNIRGWMEGVEWEKAEIEMVTFFFFLAR